MLNTIKARLIALCSGVVLLALLVATLASYFDARGHVRSQANAQLAEVARGQAQSIAESDAGIAEDLRRLIREEIAAGKSDDDIRDFLVARYGDFVLFKPPFKVSTALLWAGPFLLLGAGAVTMVLFFRRRERAAPPATLSPEEMARVSAALQEDPEPATRPTHGSGA